MNAAVAEALGQLGYETEYVRKHADKEEIKAMMGDVQEKLSSSSRPLDELGGSPARSSMASKVSGNVSE